MGQRVRGRAEERIASGYVCELVKLTSRGWYVCQTHITGMSRATRLLGKAEGIKGSESEMGRWTGDESPGRAPPPRQLGRGRRHRQCERPSAPPAARVPLAPLFAVPSAPTPLPPALPLTLCFFPPPHPLKKN